MTFSEAEEFCKGQQSGATLAAVPDYSDLSKAISFVGDYIWIGLKSTPDAQGQLHWLTFDGAQVTKTNWKVFSFEEPDDADNPLGDCVMINGMYSLELDTAGEWQDDDCGYEVKFLCALRV